MRKGGGGPKGSAFERQIGRSLSLWLTKGERADLFSRNVLSGGRFTLAIKAGAEFSQPGDLAPAHPAAFRFTSRYMVEAKHWKTLHLHQLFCLPFKRTALGKVWEKSSADAAKAGLKPFVIAKQNHLSTLVIMDNLTGEALREATDVKRGLIGLDIHRLYNGQVWIITFDHLTTYVNPDKLLDESHAFNRRPKTPRR